MDEESVFNFTEGKETTDFKQNPKILLQLLLLEDINNVKQAIETYNIVKAKGFRTTNPIINIKARAKTLFFDVRAMIKRTSKPGIYEDIKTNINNKDIDKVLEGVDTIIDILDDKKFLRIDTKVEDYTDTEAEAERKGL